jgi:hypothetical protein
MHRCGTSLVTELVGNMGVELGPEAGIMPAHPEDNPKGFFERWEIWSINEALLEALGGAWWDPPAMPRGWERSGELEPLRVRAIAELEKLGSKRWAIKDPRLSLTLPFWQPLIGPAQYIICVRHPEEVVASLQRRSQRPPAEPPIGFDGGDWARLWHTYSTSALRHTTWRSRLMVDHRRLMTRPGREVARIAAYLGATPRIDRCAQAVDHGLWRQRAELPGRAPPGNRWMYRRYVRAALASKQKAESQLRAPAARAA